VAETRYLPYGEERWITGTLVTDFTFTGQRADSYIKLMEMGARWYDPQIGRWISPDSIIPDPTNPQALNRYAYVYNNPLNHVDLTGHAVDYGTGGWEVIDEWHIPEPYSDWYSGEYSGCFMCHAGGGRILTNDELATADYQMRKAGFEAAVVMIPGAPLVRAGANLPGVWNKAMTEGLTFEEWGAWTIDALGGWAGIAGIASAAGLTSRSQVDVTRRLQALTDEATEYVDNLGMAAYTPRQQAAMAKNPNLAPAYRGSAIDRRFKLLTELDPDLTHVQTSKPFQFMPDVVDPASGQWWDLTTAGQWQAHLNKYTPTYGPNGTLIVHP
jgi:RHS repeat-associated protein